MRIGEGGLIDVQSSEGGTIFTVRLPRETRLTPFVPPPKAF